MKPGTKNSLAHVNNRVPVPFRLCAGCTHAALTLSPLLLAAAGALTSSSTPAGDTLVDRFLYKLSFPFAKKDGTEEDVAPGGCTG